MIEPKHAAHRFFDNLPDELLTASETANILKVSPQAIYLWAKEYRIPCIRLGRTVRFSRRVVQGFLDGSRSL